MTTQNITAAQPEIVGGADITSMRSMFDRDDRNIITFSARRIDYWDVKTCKPVANAPLDSIYLRKNELLVDNHRLDNSLYLFTNYGRVFLWSLEQQTWLNETTLPVQEGESLVACKVLSKRQYVYTILDNDKNTTTINYSMSRSERESPKSRKLLDNCANGSTQCFDLSSQRKDSGPLILAYINDNHLHFWLLAVNERVSETRFGRTVSDQLTCVRSNKAKPMIAVGDVRGRIYIFSGDFRSDKLDRAQLHWHSLPVNDLSFSSTGNTLYSVGGESGCVVIWDLSSNLIGQKRVIARLGLPIKYINCANSFNGLVMSFEDNDVAILDTNQNMKSINNLTRRTYPIFEKNDFRALRLAFPKAHECVDEIDTLLEKQDRRIIGLLSYSNNIITNGKTGHIQIYDPIQSRVTQTNLLRTKTLSLEKNSRVLPSDLMKGAITSDGCWLACYEIRFSDQYFPGILLHIWQRPAHNWNWVQTVDRLHESPDITDLKFSPDGKLLVSVCMDGTFHIFHRIILDTKVTENVNSKQMYVKGFSGNAPVGLPTMAAFSHDSSVLAISLKNNTVLIWMIEDPYKLVYECQLNGVSTALSSQVLGLTFSYHQEKIAPLCEVRSKGIMIWNVLNHQDYCSYKVTDSSIFTATAFDYDQSMVNFAVAKSDNQILFFKLDLVIGKTDLTPIFCVDGNLSFRRHLPSIYTHMCFLKTPILDIDLDCFPDKSATLLLSRLCLMNTHGELISFSDKLTLERRQPTIEIKPLEITQLHEYFMRSYATYNEEKKAFSTEIDVTISDKQRRIRCKLEIQKMLKSVFNRIPTHKLPAMEIMGPLILDKLVI